jgi:hypothetical protein
MRSPPLRLSDDQLNDLRAAAVPLPVEQRAGFLRVIAGYLALEGGDLDDAAFRRALAFALVHLLANTEGAPRGGQQVLGHVRSASDTLDLTPKYPGTFIP